MPTIPTLDGPQVQGRALGAPQMNLVQPDDSMTRVYDQAGRTASRIAQNEAQKADMAAIMGAEAALSKHKLNIMFDPTNGVYTKKGASALDITNNTLPEFDKQAEEIAKGLGSEQQRAQFNQIAMKQRERLDMELNQYELVQRNSFYDETDKANVDTSIQGAIQYADDPDQIAYYSAKAQFVVGENGLRKGLPPEAIAANQAKVTSDISLGVIERMATKDPMQAQQYYAKAAPFMSPDAQDHVTKLLGTAVRQQIGQNVADKIWKEGDIGIDGLAALVTDAESGGKVDAVGPMTYTGQKAQGLMQVMPDTAKQMAGELGMPYDEKRLTSDPHYNMALGKAYLSKLDGIYDGNKVLTVAAYNAGPGMVDDWIKGTNSTGKNDSHLKLGDPRKGEITDAEFMARIPFKETRNYTTKIMQKVATGAPASQRYADGLKVANTIPDKQTRDAVVDNLENYKKADDAQVTAKFEQASEYLSNGGIQAVPASLLSSLPVDDQLKLHKLDAAINKADPIKTDYTKLESFLSMPPEKLASLSLERDLRPYLNNGDLSTVQAAWTKAKTGDDTVQKVSKAKEDAVKGAMAMAGIAVGASKDAMEPKNLQSQELFRANLQSRVDSFKAKNKREPDLEETESMASDMALSVRLKGGGKLYGDSTSRPLWQVAPEDADKVMVDKGDLSVGKIPAMERKRIIDALRQAGMTASEDNILNAYAQGLKRSGLQVQ